MTERTTVEFTQNGKRITFSAGYIVAVCGIHIEAKDSTASPIKFSCALITQLGIVPIDQGECQALVCWRNALAEPDPIPHLYQISPRAPLGNNAEF